MQSEATSRTYQVFPNSRFEVVEDATHFPFEKQTEIFTAVVGEFLNEMK
jgi:pimeloyl-ACP methyl ester carboxylesterase